MERRQEVITTIGVILWGIVAITAVATVLGIVDLTRAVIG